MNFFKFIMLIGIYQKYKHQIITILSMLFFAVIFNFFMNDLISLDNSLLFFSIKWGVNIFIILTTIFIVKYQNKKYFKKEKINKNQFLSKNLQTKTDKIIQKYKNVSKTT